MKPSDAGPQDLDITVRVRCRLGYQVTGSATLLRNLRLAPDSRRSVLFEVLTLGNDLEPDTFDDSHGNRIYRLAPEVLRYTLLSRYCDSDKLTDFAWETFGHCINGSEIRSF